MTDFQSEKVEKYAKRRLTNPIADAAAFVSVIDGFVGAGATIGFGTNYNRTKFYFRAPIKFFDAMGAIVTEASVELYHPDATEFNRLWQKVQAVPGLIEAMTGQTEDEGASLSSDPTYDTYYCRYRIIVHKDAPATGEVAEDEFDVVFTRNYVLVNGYNNDSSLAAIETWADSNTNLA